MCPKQLDSLSQARLMYNQSISVEDLSELSISLLHIPSHPNYNSVTSSDTAAVYSNEIHILPASHKFIREQLGFDTRLCLYK